MISKNIASAIEFASSFCPIRFPIDLKRVCDELNIKVICDYPLDKDGYLICQNGKKIILINSNITNSHRQKFIIAHELGHFLLHREQLYSCDHISEAVSQTVNSQIQENEANTFANKLLIPSEELKKYIPIGPITFSDVFKIADSFDVSVTHAAMQAVMASNDESEILICYEQQKRKWYMSAYKYTYPRMVPSICPIPLSNANFEIDINGAWTSLYDGSVHQEVFHSFGDQYLVLLSGKRI